MSEPLDMAGLRAAMERVESERHANPWVVEVRCRDNATLVHRLNEPEVIRAQESWQSAMGAHALFSIPVVLDPGVPERVLRVKLSDGTVWDIYP